MEKVGDLVLSQMGRDKGELFFIIGFEGERLLLADGKIHRVEKPKKKKPKHTKWVGRAADFAEKPTNRELRRMMGAYLDVNGGMPNAEG